MVLALQGRGKQLKFVGDHRAGMSTASVRKYGILQC
jgi:hypothetical protein